jgi:hypothetical protein
MELRRFLPTKCRAGPRILPFWQRITLASPVELPAWQKPLGGRGPPAERQANARSGVCVWKALRRGGLQLPQRQVDAVDEVLELG